jgi:O-antigen ligase
LLFVFVIFSVISISIMQAAYILAIVAWITGVYLQGSYRQLRFPLILPLGSFALASLVSTITGVAPAKSLSEFRNVFAASLFFLVVNAVATAERATALIKTLIATGAAMALYGLLQAVSHEMSVRIYGTMSIYMTFAGLLMLVHLVALAQVLYQPDGRQALWYLAACLCLTAALLMTATRSAWLGCIAGSCVALGLRKKFLLLGLPLIMLLVFFMAPRAVQERILSIADQKHITVQERLSMWRSGWQIVRDHPWTGIGMGAMVQTYQRYREPDSPVDPRRRIGHLHNNVLQVAAERGLLGLSCWLWIWGAYSYYSWSMYRRLRPEHRAARALVVGSMASVLGFHVAGLFEHTFGDTEVISLVYFLMALPFVVQRLPVCHAGQPVHPEGEL